jgi:hypothetical protein
VRQALSPNKFEVSANLSGWRGSEYLFNLIKSAAKLPLNEYPKEIHIYTTVKWTDEKVLSEECIEAADWQRVKWESLLDALAEQGLLKKENAQLPKLSIEIVDERKVKTPLPKLTYDMNQKFYTAPDGHIESNNASILRHIKASFEEALKDQIECENEPGLLRPRPLNELIYSNDAAIFKKRLSELDKLILNETLPEDSEWNTQLKKVIADSTELSSWETYSIKNSKKTIPFLERLLKHRKVTKDECDAVLKGVFFNNTPILE